MIGVVVVDDHPVVLSGLTALIGAEDDLDVVGAARSAHDARALDPSPPPDVCVVDLHLPDGDGVSLGKEMAGRWDCRVLVLTMSSDPAAVVRSLGEGLHGYLLKDSDPDELLGAIRAVAAGAVVLGRGASAPVVAATRDARSTGDALAVLDARDREILALLVQGQGTQHIAARLFLAPKTIRNRVSEMLTKLGVATREDAIAIGRSAGLGR
jgi:DNA-binding NarL/FixJ family response regulator